MKEEINEKKEGMLRKKGRNLKAGGQEARNVKDGRKEGRNVKDGREY